MNRFGTAILLILFLGLLSPALAQTEVWRCTQPDGTDLFTNTPQDLAKCQKYVSGTELGFVSGVQEATPPALDTAPPVSEPPAQTEAPPQAPPPYPQAGYDQGTYPSYGYSYYYGSPGAYGSFIRPRFFHFHRRPPFQSPFHFAPQSGFHHGGGHGGGHKGRHRGGHGRGGHR